MWTPRDRCRHAVDRGGRASREHAVAARASVLVQAPAGSGKTTLLTQRYLRLLATVDAPERILALTFTRRAAQEMRERVFGALQAAALTTCPAHANPQTWALAVAAKRHMEALQIDIERHPSRLRIETIDAFNAWLAGQLPITAGAGARLQLLDNAGPLYEQAARRALAHEDEDAFGVAVDRVLALDDQRWRRLVELIAEMLPGRDRWLPLLAGHLQAASALDEAQLRRVRPQFDEDLELLVTRTLRDARTPRSAAKESRRSRRCCARPRSASRGRRAPMAEWRIEQDPLQPDVRHLARWRAHCAGVLDERFAAGCAQAAHAGGRLPAGNAPRSSP